MEKLSNKLLEWIKNNPKQSILYGCFAAGFAAGVIKRYIDKLTPSDCILELELTDIEFTNVSLTMMIFK